jgi:RNase adapter protein RapZ
MRPPVAFGGMTEFAVITGLSGAGRSTVADALEDRGWFVIDNLPTPLIPKVAELAIVPESSIELVALALGSSAQPQDILPAIADLRAGPARVRVVFLEASTDSLVRRYESTKRRHPRSTGEQLAQTIEHERSLLEPVKAEADVIVDTTHLNIYELRNRVAELFADGERDDHRMQTTLLSFGYKHGLPTDVDIVLDCRFLPNPHWIPELRPKSGLDGEVVDYVLQQPVARPFLVELERTLALLIPAYVREGKSFLSIALGCTGGRHRSVVMAEQAAAILRRHGLEPTVDHRDIDR